MGEGAEEGRRLRRAEEVGGRGGSRAEHEKAEGAGEARTTIVLGAVAREGTVCIPQPSTHTPGTTVECRSKHRARSPPRSFALGSV